MAWFSWIGDLFGALFGSGSVENAEKIESRMTKIVERDDKEKEHDERVKWHKVYRIIGKARDIENKLRSIRSEAQDVDLIDKFIEQIQSLRKDPSIYKEKARITELFRVWNQVTTKFKQLAPGSRLSSEAEDVRRKLFEIAKLLDHQASIIDQEIHILKQKVEIEEKEEKAAA